MEADELLTNHSNVIKAKNSSLSSSLSFSSSSNSSDYKNESNTVPFNSFSMAPKDMPPPDEQLKIIESIPDQDQYVVGQDAYLIPSDFLNQWFSYVYSASAEGTSMPPKGPIITRKNYNIRTRTPIFGREKDYTPVTKPTWEYFQKWYGGIESTVAVEYDEKEEKATPVLEAFETRINFGDDSKPLIVPKFISIKEYLKKCLALFDIKYSEDQEPKDEENTPEKTENSSNIVNNVNPYEPITSTVEEDAPVATGAPANNSNPYTNNSVNEEEAPISFSDSNNVQNNIQPLVDSDSSSDDKSPKLSENSNIIFNNSEYSSAYTATETTTEDQNTMIDNPTFSDFRLFDYYNKTLSNQLEIGKYLDDYSIATVNDILLDYKLKNGSWYSETIPKYNTTSYTGTYNFNYNDSYTTSYNYQTPSYNSYNYNHYGGYYGYSYGTPPGPGKVGFQNLGNTCFFNSGIQCLMHSKPLVKMLLGESWKQDINEINPLGTKGRLVRAFQKLLEEVWSGNSRVLAPSELKQVIGEFSSRFAGWGQQDSHELITFMLDGIHEDLNRCRVKPQIDTVIGDGINDAETADLAWTNHMKRNDSIIHDIFYAQLRSRCICPKCGKTIVVFDPYSHLSLPISNPKIKQVKVTFVPYNFSEKYETLSLNVPIIPKQKDYEDAISKAISRDVKVVICSLSTAKSLKLGIIEGYSVCNYIAFEIPDVSKLYVPCIVKTMQKDNYYYSTPQLKNVGEYFLLPISKEYAFDSNNFNFDQNDSAEKTSKALTQLEDEAEVYLKEVWNKNLQETEEGKEMKEKTQYYGEDIQIKQDKIFTASLKSTYYYDNSTSFTYSDEYPNVTSITATLYINDEYRTEKKGFLYSQLMKHSSEIVEDNSMDNESGGVTLDKCFEYFCTEEVLDEDNEWRCPNCEQFVCATKKMDLWSVPKCLVIHLKRFSAGEYYSHKDERYVDYPDVIDIGKYIVGPHPGCTKYQLYAVSEHMGSLGGGHYTAHAVVSPLDKNTGEWYSFNDSSASESTAASAHNASAYVLFYQRMDEDCPVIEGGQQNENTTSDSDLPQLNKSQDSSSDNEIILDNNIQNSNIRRIASSSSDEEEDDEEDGDKKLKESEIKEILSDHSSDDEEKQRLRPNSSVFSSNDQQENNNQQIKQSLSETDSDEEETKEKQQENNDSPLENENPTLVRKLTESLSTSSTDDDIPHND
ncbi:Clan CA, family C19, ubiquitin hydrolase-like cysteine peptidase [Trichomonas vaginalis G3]|uniref:ubiquitinyl hydrolase 1 n=1 Tax=Trichomonas vaginalis (strain ATCC PRA-98 / G3) TaxID=412133 RepID=A2F7X4_TRIV3|nr:ubiquitin carboxyl-terminal hydrolase family [Trichomonas vaginalis G3]EAX98968.1 Clan CA, family C19, ubiquitin hydrolase-like cysteine peptidase [Trichomonas vaginalis G3]KAI5507226.1 ubiquitin carboxyl-terminal hydrolase family [Trichomonas vaginalis G3]|eukprot:XP_001311898.1 Clan CA, family C19, ubiquitin hydrolase-like cysteine peptidase [Trichomonas vaginalis G3]